MRATIAHRIILFMRMAAARAAFCCGAYSPSSESVSAAASAGREVLLQQLPAAAGTQQTPLTDKIPPEIGFIQPPSQMENQPTNSHHRHTAITDCGGGVEQALINGFFMTALIITKCLFQLLFRAVADGLTLLYRVTVLF